MVKFHIKQAYEFYKESIYNRKLQGVLAAHRLQIPGSVPSVIWELFGAILTGDKGKRGYGSDLKRHEIKSAIEGGSFEYQYHLRGGQQKLTEDMGVKHLFISYSKDYSNVSVRILPGEELKEIFSGWLPKLVENYTGPNKKQRYRKSVSLGLVKQKGILIMHIKDGDLIKHDPV
jgi:hypothetical protein